jgi:hypothetical protein
MPGVITNPAAAAAAAEQRSCCSAMTKTLDSTAVYAYTTLISMIVCLPFAVIAEGSALQAGAAAAIQKVGGSGALGVEGLQGFAAHMAQASFWLVQDGPAVIWACLLCCHHVTCSSLEIGFGSSQ